MDPQPPEDWLNRCTKRIVQVDPGMNDGEALALACELQRFERTAAMAAEAAVEFVASAQALPGHRFERRLTRRR